jgi:hypothetical protein
MTKCNGLAEILAAKFLKIMTHFSSFFTQNVILDYRFDVLRNNSVTRIFFVGVLSEFN